MAEIAGQTELAPDSSSEPRARKRARESHGVLLNTDQRQELRERAQKAATEWILEEAILTDFPFQSLQSSMDAQTRTEFDTGFTDSEWSA